MQLNQRKKEKNPKQWFERPNRRWMNKNAQKNAVLRVCRCRCVDYSLVCAVEKSLTDHVQVHARTDQVKPPKCFFFPFFQLIRLHLKEAEYPILWQLCRVCFAKQQTTGCRSTLQALLLTNLTLTMLGKGCKYAVISHLFECRRSMHIIGRDKLKLMVSWMYPRGMCYKVVHH